MGDGGLFHEDCGSLLEYRTVEGDTGKYEVGYCGNCDEVADIEAGDEWNLLEEQEEGELEELLDSAEAHYDEEDLINYDFDNCEHDTAIQEIEPPQWSDEGPLKISRCVTCGNTERAGENDWR